MDGLLGLGDDRMDEVREIAVDGELDDLGVDEDEFEFVGAEAVDQRENEITDTDGFAGSGGAGDEGVRCAGEVEDDVTAGDIDAEDEGEFAGGVAPSLGFEGRAEGEGGGVAIGDFDADEALARDGGLDADGVGGKGEREIFFEGDDQFNADTEAGFDAELSDARADDRVVDEGVDREAVEGVLENALVGGEFLGTGKVFFVGRGRTEEVERGTLVACEIGEGERSRRSRRVWGFGSGVWGRRRSGGGGVRGRTSALAAYRGGEIGGAVADGLADTLKVVEGVVELVAMAGLVGETFLQTGVEFIAPAGELVLVFL